MTRLIEGREVERVLIVDDQPDARGAYGELVEDLDLVPVKVSGPVDEDRILGLATEADVILCDYHLKRQEYAECDGDVLLARCVERGMAGVLCTGYSDFGLSIRRDCLRWIPSRVRSREVKPEAFLDGWAQCLREIGGSLHPARRPWRTLVRVVETDLERGYVSAIVPGWSVREAVQVQLESVPREFQGRLLPDARFFCQVNIGAESEDDLFFDGWEVGDAGFAEQALHS